MRVLLFEATWLVKRKKISCFCSFQVVDILEVDTLLVSLSERGVYEKSIPNQKPTNTLLFSERRLIGFSLPVF